MARGTATARIRTRRYMAGAVLRNMAGAVFRSGAMFRSGGMAGAMVGLWLGLCPGLGLEPRSA